ncbi:helix-turn-helix transcriptional regulator [Actinophytocola sediminis]
MTPGSRALGSALRKAREDAFPGTRLRGSLRRVALSLGISHSTLSQWETGKRVPAAEDVARLLTVLGVAGSRYARIMEIARHARQPNWVTTGLPGISQALSGILEYERTCNRLAVWAPLFIPGLLQSGDYARALIGRRDRSIAEIESRVKLRVGRRETLTRRNAPEYRAFIGEQALRQGVGGPEVMADQLRFVLKVDDEHENVTIQVVPIGNGAHDGLSGPFELYEFPDTPPSVLLEHLRSSLFLSDDDGGDDVQGFRDAAEKDLPRVALSVAKSRALIAEIVSEYERTT